MAGFFASIAIATGLHISGLRDCQSVNTAAVSRQVFNPSKLLLAGGHFLGNNKTFLNLVGEIPLAGQPREAIFRSVSRRHVVLIPILSNTKCHKLKRLYFLCFADFKKNQLCALKPLPRVCLSKVHVAPARMTGAYR